MLLQDPPKKKVKIYPYSKKPRLWTKRGLKQLGILIRRSREDLSWSLDELVRQIQQISGETIAKKTIANIENAVSVPAYNTLAAIAAVGFVEDKKSGKILDEFDFINIASEVYPMIRCLVDLINEAMAINKVSIKEAYSRLEIMRIHDVARLSDKDLELIFEGKKIPNDDELRVLRELIDPDGEAFTEDQWMEALIPSLSRTPPRNQKS